MSAAGEPQAMRAVGEPQVMRAAGEPKVRTRHRSRVEALDGCQRSRE